MGKQPELIVDGPEVPPVYARMRRIVEQLNRVFGEPIDRWLVVPPDKLFFELPETTEGADQVTIRRLADDAFEVVFERSRRRRRQPPEIITISRHAPLQEAELLALFARRLGRPNPDHHRRSSPRRV